MPTLYFTVDSCAAMANDTLPEWSKGVDSSSTSASCVGSNPTGVILHAGCYVWRGGVSKSIMAELLPLVFNLYRMSCQSEGAGGEYDEWYVNVST